MRLRQDQGEEKIMTACQQIPRPEPTSAQILARARARRLRRSFNRWARRLALHVAYMVIALYAAVQCVKADTWYWDIAAMVATMFAVSEGIAVTLSSVIVYKAWRES